MPLKFDFKRIYSSVSERVKATDVHPSEPWILVALYTGQANVHNYETMAIIKTFECGNTPIRAAIFLSRKNWVVCGSDDLTIRVFNYHTLEKVHSFEAHSDYPRCLVVHPNRSLLITCSDDLFIKVWDWERRWECVQKLEGHHHYIMQVAINPKDLNQIASASLDKSIKIWTLGNVSTPNFTLEGHDKNKNCVHTLTGHVNNVTRAIFHPNLPLIISISEDGSAIIWNNSTFRIETSLKYAMGRMWCMSAKKGSNELVLGCDDGVIVLRAGKETPTCCMDSTGKIFYAKQNHILQANAKNFDEPVKDGEKMGLSFTEMGTCEIYPQSLVSSPNGRFLAVVGDGEFIIYTTIALRNKLSATGDRFVWHKDSTTFVVRDSYNLVLYKDFKVNKRSNLKVSFEELFAGELIGVKSASEIHFYEWSDLNFIIVVDVSPSNVYWNIDSTLCCLCESNAIHILKYNAAVVESSLENVQSTESGVSDAFEVLPLFHQPFSQLAEDNRLSYAIGDQLFSISHIQRPSYVVGYLHNQNRLYLVDREGNVLSYYLDMHVIEFEIAILKKNYDLANSIENKWKTLGKLASDIGRFDIAINCYKELKDAPALLILSYALSDRNLLDETLTIAKELGNVYVQFLVLHMTNKVSEAIDLFMSANMDSQAALLAYSYAPERMAETFANWKNNLTKVHPKQAEQLADPIRYSNLFSTCNQECLADQIVCFILNKKNLKVDEE
ncbi:Coatomer subunit beta' [Thelohanellus kitauei]|uniref:Beta'-coat protein n=1 Tax=Thelohanellus kitauei TaxID=669202 RepID=A0A0C2M083_THEKT|nr:Coatomer subunit beta' [Thelohanellus kitauei]